jgi:hypothetical protein
MFQDLMTAVKLVITFKRIQREFILAALCHSANKKCRHPEGVTAFFLLTAFRPYFSVKPFSLASFRQAVMPFLLMVRIASVETFRVTHLFSSGMKNLLV